MPAFYVSGPKAMVEAMEGALHTIGIADEKIKQDYFPGYDS
jgi:ferredoxin-NADP reductase